MLGVRRLRVVVLLRSACRMRPRLDKAGTVNRECESVAVWSKCELGLQVDDGFGVAGL